MTFKHIAVLVVVVLVTMYLVNRVSFLKSLIS
jgi:hypothetical protein